MTSYTAKFSDGSTKTIKNSTKLYTAAWQAKVTRPDGSMVTIEGFARDAELAQSSARNEASHIGHTYDERRRKWIKPTPPYPTQIEVVAVAAA